MKKMLVVSALILYTGIAVGQSLQKDNVFTLHVLEVNLKAGVTMDQFMDVVYEEYLPALSEAFPDVKGPLLKGIRGEHEFMLGLLGIYESEEGLKKYWPETDVASELYKERYEIVRPVRQKMEQLAELNWVTWTSWKVDFILGDETYVSSFFPEMDIDFSAYPNPFSDHITFEYELQKAENVRIEVYNSLGQLVATPVHGVQQAGKNTIHWNGGNNSDNTLKEGVYNVRLQTANSAKSIGTIIKLSR